MYYLPWFRIKYVHVWNGYHVVWSYNVNPEHSFQARFIEAWERLPCICWGHLRCGEPPVKERQLLPRFTLCDITCPLNKNNSLIVTVSIKFSAYQTSRTIVSEQYKVPYYMLGNLYKFELGGRRVEGFWKTQLRGISLLGQSLCEGSNKSAWNARIYTNNMPWGKGAAA